jgi:pilin isopeptide linkage protein/LPXTG-motif cell wall-anchored protein
MKKNKTKLNLVLFVVLVLMIQLVRPILSTNAYATEATETTVNETVESISNHEQTTKPEEQTGHVSEVSDGTETTETNPLSDTEEQADHYLIEPDADLASDSQKNNQNIETNRIESKSDFTTFGLIEENLVTSFSLSYNNGKGEWTTVDSGGVHDVDLTDVNAVSIKFELIKPNELTVNAGDTYELDLPSFFTGSVEDKSITIEGNEVATYSIIDGKVVITFNEHAENYDDTKMHIDLSGSFDTEVFKEVEEVDVTVPFRDGTSFTKTIRPKADPYEGEDKKTAGFQYVLDGETKKEVTRNPEYIDWTVLANDSMESIGSAKIIDDLGDNLEIVEGSIKAYRIIRNYQNEEIGREEVTVTSDMVTYTSSGFELDLGNIDDAYEVTYTTNITRPDGGGTHTINNKARIVLDGDETPVSDSFTGTWSGDLPVIDKSGSKTDDPHILNWEVEYNYSKENLGTVNLTDVLTHGEVDLDTVEVYTVDVDVDGNRSNPQLVDVTPVLSEDGTLTIPGLDASGKAYYITYSSSVPVGLDTTVVNEIKDDLPEPNTDSASVPVKTIPTGGKVGEQGVDDEGHPYIEWTLTLNSTKVDVGSIAIRDVFNPEYLKFDVEDSNLYKLYKDGEPATNFTIEDYTHTIDGTPDGRTGFKLVVDNAGPHTYEFVYRTYYTQAGMAEPELANHAELVFLDGSGNGIGPAQPLPDAKLKGPKAGIHKNGWYVPTEDGTEQGIEWQIDLNGSKVLLNVGTTITETFTSGNFEYIAGSLFIKDQLGNTLILGTDYSLDVGTDGKGFVVTLLKATNKQLTMLFKTTADDVTNLDQVNDVSLKWQGGTETATKTVGKRDPGIDKLGDVVINADGSKTVNWTVNFNTNNHVIHEFVLIDTYSPSTVTVTDIKITAGDKDVTGDFTISDERTGGTFTVQKERLDAKVYTLTYSTTLSPEEERVDLVNTVDMTYTGGSSGTSITIPKPVLNVEKSADSIDRTGDVPLINWTIKANTDSANKFVNLVDAVLEDTIPEDQKLVPGSVEVVRVGDPEFEVSITDIEEADNGDSFTINLPDGPYEYKVTFKTQILQMPSLDGTFFDRYNNSVKLTNQKDTTLETSDDADAWIRYYDGRDHDLTTKTGSQNDDTENVDYKVTINPDSLTIHNAKIKDTLSTNHTYVDGSIKLFDAAGAEVTTGFNLDLAENKHSFEIDFNVTGNATGTINSKYTIKYSTRLNDNLIGTYNVTNKIVLTGGTDGKELHYTEKTTSAQQWFYGGGGEGRTVRLEVNKHNNQVDNPGDIEGAKFKLERVNLNGSRIEIDAEIETNENGIFIKEGIRAGRYVLTEVSTPDLYQKLEDPIYFLIGYTHPDNYIKDEAEEVTNPYTIQITNSNWEDGSHSHAEAENDVLTVTNDYKPAKLALAASKQLTGQSLEKDQFSFALYDSSNNKIDETTNDEAGQISFTELNFDNTGTYTYKIRELEGNQGGMDYDDAVFNVTVIVSEGSEGLVAVPTYTDATEVEVDLPEFNNIYEASGEWTPTVTKNLDAGGRDLEADEFNFKLVPVDGAPMPTGATELLASNDANGNVSFASIPYTEADTGKTYQYDIVEVVLDAETGMTYDTKTVRYSVLVNDNRNGTLEFNETVVEGGAAEFNNSYEADGSYVIPTLNKELENLPLGEGDFTFILKPVDGATMPLGENGALDQLLAVNTADGKITFDTELTYTQEDIGETYYYTITEEVGDKGGIYYDPLVVTLKVVVEDLGNGKLSAVGSFVPADGQDEADTTFNNIYTANKSWRPTFSKVLAAGGRQLQDGEFEFKLTPIDGAKMPTDDNDVSLTELTVTNDAEGKIIFDEISYSHEDDGATYRYKIVEVNGGETGMSYDPMEIFIDVAITDLLNGNLELVVTILDSDDPVADTVFNNSYEASGEWIPEVSKVLTAGGRDLLANEFNFKLTPVDNATMPEDADELLASNDADGKVVFATIPYTEADIGQTYYYEIVEVAGTEDGMTYDEMTITYKVVITDAGNGELNVVYTVEGEEADSEFNNIYKATGEWTAEVSKVLTAGGRDLLANEFNFKLTPVDNATMPEDTDELLASNDADGKVVFATIPYTEADIGQTYYYEIVEVAGTEDGMTYDEMTITYKVVITDAGNGELNVVYTVEGEEADSEFNNIYKATGEWTAEVSKDLAAGGRGLLANEFNFKLTPVDNATMPEDADELITSNDADGKVVFATIPYTEADIGQTYYYEIVEVAGTEDGMTYDEMTVTYKVVITDAGNGELNVVHTVEGETTDTEFNNTYVASGSYTAEVSKELSGRELFDEEFNFRLIPVDGATMPVGEDDEPLAELTAVNIDGKVLFATIPYTEADIGETYTYLITELAGTEGSITYDPLVITLEVAITDGGNGELIIDTTYLAAEGSEEADTVFNNEYHADGSWVPTASKQLLAGGRELLADEFIFELYLLEDDEETWTLLQTASNAADGGVVFEPVSYSELDVDQEYSYKIIERAATENGMSYSDLEVTILVTVTDPELLGELEVTTEYSVDRLFINTYEAGGSFAPELTKDLLGRDLAADEFSFTLKPVDGAPLPLDEAGEPLSELTATNAADGKIVFADIAFTEADIGQTYTYLITELAGELGGVAYSEQEIVLTVSISDAGNGELAISTLYTDDATFTNTYTVDPIEVVFSAEKILSGKELVADQFEFELIDENGQVVATAKNAQDGSIVFDSIIFEETGEFMFIVREVEGNETGYTYDSTEYRIQLLITDNGDGTLNSEIIELDGGIVFNNEYKEVVAPKTGENGTLSQLLGTLMIGLGLTFLVIRRKKLVKEPNK